MTREIRTSNGPPARVSDEDFDVLSAFKWNVDGRGYARRSINAPRVDGMKRKVSVMLMHRQIMAPPDGLFVDHCRMTAARLAAAASSRVWKRPARRRVKVPGCSMVPDEGVAVKGTR